MAYNTPRTGGLLLVCGESVMRRQLQSKMQIYRRVRAVDSLDAARKELSRATRSFTAVVVDVGERPSSMPSFVSEVRRSDATIPIVCLHRKPLGVLLARTLSESAVLSLPLDDSSWPVLKAHLRRSVILERCRGNRFIADAVEELASSAALTIKQAELVAMATDTLPRSEMAKQLGVSPSTLVNRIYALVERLQMRSFDVVGKTLLRSAVDRAAAEPVVRGALDVSRVVRRSQGSKALSRRPC